MKIAVFHYNITKNSPSGSCVLKLVEALKDKHEIVAFSNKLDVNKSEVEWIKVPMIRRPMVLMFITYYITVTFSYLFYRIRTKGKIDKVLITENMFYLGDISYAHICHREYVKHHFKLSGGLVNFSYYLNYKIRAFFEPIVYKKMEHFIVPSNGLKRELEKVYPFTQGKISVISNSIDIEKVTERINQAVYEDKWKHKEECLKLVFVALGNFQSKGLDFVFDSLVRLKNESIKLCVVGGTSVMVSLYKKNAKNLKIDDKVDFVGFQRDIYPFLEEAHAFIFPSKHETFPLVSLEAAAAGIPLIVTKIYGVEEFMIDGETGIYVDRTVESITKALTNTLRMTPEELMTMGLNAQKEVEKFNLENFNKSWVKFFG